MENQEQIIYITNREQKDIIDILDAYKKTLEAGYKQVKKKKTFQSVILSQLVDEIQRTGKLINNLKNKYKKGNE